MIIAIKTCWMYLLLTHFGTAIFKMRLVLLFFSVYRDNIMKPTENLYLDFKCENKITYVLCVLWLKSIKSTFNVFSYALWVYLQKE